MRSQIGKNTIETNELIKANTELKLALNQMRIERDEISRNLSEEFEMKISDL